jgi:hypothetical protein
MIASTLDRLAEIRARLSSLSWFMRALAEPIARRANREDHCTGRFWEGRYKCQPILDESALAACLAYVDLNPIRARIATTPETSRFTSVFERINVLCAVPDSSDRAPCATWLSPFELSAEETRQPIPPARASNSGCLPMPFADYLRLVDWTGRQLRQDKRGAIPGELAPILERLHVTGEGWLQLVEHFSRLFRRAAGRPTSLSRDAAKLGRRRRSGIAASRAFFV